MDIEVSFLEIANGKCPYLDWEKKLDKAVHAAARIRINRLRLGNFGDCKNIKGAKGALRIKNAYRSRVSHLFWEGKRYSCHPFMRRRHGIPRERYPKGQRLVAVLQRFN